MRLRRALSAVAILALSAAATGCTGSVNAPAGGSPGHSGVTTNLPDLGLAHVTTETAAARGATIGPDGGSISATGTNGATYTLTIPKGAVHADTAIGLYPVSKVSGLPGATTLAAAAQFSPDGFRLTIAATFTIKMPAGTDAAALSGVAWTGDAAGGRRYPAVVEGSTITMRVLHFSGAGAGNGADLPNGSADCPDLASMDALIDADHSANRTDRAAYTRDLKTCYRQFVLPAMQASEAYAEAHDLGFDEHASPPDAAEEYPALDGYAAWRLDLEVVDAWLGGGGFDVSPELTDSLLPARHLLRAWYDAINDECIALADPAMDSGRATGAILLANEALTEHYHPAEQWGVATVENKLDLATLLDDLCVRVVIDPSRDFSGAKPGDDGKLTVPLGYSIAHGPTRHDRELQLEFGLADSQDRTLAFDANVVTHDLSWPEDVDPLKIDLLARMPYPYGEIARFDRITKGSETGRIAFRSDRGGGPIPQLWAMNEDGSNAEQLTHDTPGQTSLNPAWSPDGKQIAFASTRGGARAQIWISDAHGGGAQQFTHFDAQCLSPTWSPDGLKIAYSSDSGDADGRYRIFIADATEGDGEALTETQSGGGDLDPRWSPDGSKILFTAVHRGGLNGQQLYLVDLGHPDVVIPLTSGDETTSSTGASWSPDGAQIIFVHRSGTSLAIWMMDADGRNASPIFSLPSTSVSHPVFSPDGTHVAFEMAWTNDPGHFGIFTIDLAGGDLKPLSPAGSNETNPVWVQPTSH